MSDENENERPAGPYLTRAKMLPVDGVVYCLEHGAVHEDTTDPYDYGYADCDKREHRPVYYRGRKGDFDEVTEARFVAAEPRHGEDDEGADGEIVDTREEIQEKVMRRVIAKASEPLTGEERDLAVKMLARDYARTAAAYGELRDLAGHGDLSAVETKLERLHSALGKLGAAPG